MNKENPKPVQGEAQEVPLKKPSKRKGTRRGYFRPLNPTKYEGDSTNIIYRSGIELRFMRHIDSSPSVLTWTSEETVVLYRNPLDPPTYKKLRRYFVDFKLTIKGRDGKLRTELIELKWSTDTVEPKVPKKRTARYLRDRKNWLVNTAKWDAAKLVCEAKGWNWRIITEKHLKPEIKQK